MIIIIEFKTSYGTIPRLFTSDEICSIKLYKEVTK